MQKGAADDEQNAHGDATGIPGSRAAARQHTGDERDDAARQPEDLPSGAHEVDTSYTPADSITAPTGGTRTEANVPHRWPARTSSLAVGGRLYG